jgi:hypothetical protein
MIFLGIYIGVMYTIGIASYLGYKKNEQYFDMDVYDWIFIIVSPISIPLLLISNLINPNQND